MRATVKQGSKRRAKSPKEIKRDVGKAAKSGAKSGTKSAKTKRAVNYPIAETLRWVGDGEKLLVKWGAIKSPGAKRIANTVGQILSVLEALTELRKA